MGARRGRVVVAAVLVVAGVLLLRTCTWDASRVETTPSPPSDDPIDTRADSIRVGDPVVPVARSGAQDSSGSRPQAARPRRRAAAAVATTSAPQDGSAASDTSRGTGQRADRRIQHLAGDAWPGRHSTNVFGDSVAIEGDVTVVGTPVRRAESDAGAAFIYQRGDDGWLLAQRLDAPEGTHQQAFGSEVAVDADHVVVFGGRAREEDCPSFHDYVRADHGRWELRESVRVGGPAQDVFDAVIADGVAVVACQEPRIRVFRRGAGGWRETQTIERPDDKDRRTPASRLALDGGLLLVRWTEASPPELRVFRDVDGTFCEEPPRSRGTESASALARSGAAWARWDVDGYFEIEEVPDRAERTNVPSPTHYSWLRPLAGRDDLFVAASRLSDPPRPLCELVVLHGRPDGWRCVSIPLPQPLEGGVLRLVNVAVDGRTVAATGDAAHRGVWFVEITDADLARGTPLVAK
jgi:hypothetical protein